MERYRSGHNGADSKSVRPQGLVGSNPTRSAKHEKSGEFRLKRNSTGIHRFFIFSPWHQEKRNVVVLSRFVSRRRGEKNRNLMFLSRIHLIDIYFWYTRYCLCRLEQENTADHRQDTDDADRAEPQTEKGFVQGRRSEDADGAEEGIGDA